MRWNIQDRRTRLEALALAILVAGLLLSAVIDRTAADQPGPLLGYDAQSGTPLPVDPEDSKRYLREMEQYNGKAGVMMYQLRTWFAGLWQGRTLARTLFCLSVAGAAGALYASRAGGASGRDAQQPPKRSGKRP